MNIYLKYSNDNWTTETADSFSAISCVEMYERERESANTLNGTVVSHLKSKRKVYKIIISANELYQTAKMSYLKSFFNSGFKKLSFDNTTFFEVEMTDDEDISFPTKSKLLPRCEFTLKSKYKE